MGKESVLSGIEFRTLAKQRKHTKNRFVLAGQTVPKREKSNEPKSRQLIFARELHKT
jgi:hypothetical protein